jgi:hypothetical protein
MESVRKSFVEQFGEEQAQRIEEAAYGHKNGAHDHMGSDPFKWAILICIGYECFTEDDYRMEHRITAPAQEIKEWAKKNGNLDTHDGDVDFLALFDGSYDEYMPKEELEVQGIL